MDLFFQSFVRLFPFPSTSYAFLLTVDHILFGVSISIDSVCFPDVCLFFFSIIFTSTQEFNRYFFTVKRFLIICLVSVQVQLI